MSKLTDDPIGQARGRRAVLRCLFNLLRLGRVPIRAVLVDLEIGRVPSVREDRHVDTRLTRLTLDIERHVAAAGWDQPPHLFALVETADLVRREPQLAAQMSGTADVPGAITPVDQGDLPPHSTLEELLGGIVWPPEVLGTALSVERLMVPPEAERDMPQDEGAALSWLAQHPERQEVRIVVAVLRDGSRGSALRMRAHDDEQSILTGADLVPGLADALAATLAD